MKIIILRKRKLDIESQIPDEDLNKKLKTEESVENDLTIDALSNGHAVFNPKLLEKDPECFECAQFYRDPQRSDLTMYLHALSYKVNWLIYSFNNKT